jgi:H+/Cl- antiporter ClcA/CBS domain-containing protein
MAEEPEAPRPKALEALPAGEALPISPGLTLISAEEGAPTADSLISLSVLRVCLLAILLGAAATVIARLLVALIELVTNFAFFQRFSFAEASPADNQLGLFVIVVPILGGLIVGFMARYGSKAIRGHGIPEAMEQILTNKSRIPARITILKPLSAAVAIGTGGPFGAEGPIIATGGALGSMIGQLTPTTAAERKTLLAAGAAAGMTAIFGTPLAAVLLAIELLLFEFRPRSLIPVALACVAAAGLRTLLVGIKPVFPADFDHATTLLALLSYAAIGAIMGLIAAGITEVLYLIEDAFEKLPVHFMWWPAIGGIAIGVCGYIAPRTLGIGYENIDDLLQGKLVLQAVLFLGVMKFISWSISLGSGTSGGTLAPLLTLGGCAGGAMGLALKQVAPQLEIDPGLAALVGMAAMFAGAARAPLASAVFALEATLQPLAIVPLLAGCIAAYLVSCRVMQNTIMTEKIARRGVLAPKEYVPDVFALTLARDAASRNVVALRAEDTLAQARAWVESGETGSQHQGFPVLTVEGVLAGVLTQRDLRDSSARLDTPLAHLTRQPVRFVYEDSTLRQAMDHMLNHDIGRLPVVSRDHRPRVVGFLTRSDILKAQRRNLEESHVEPPTIVFGRRSGKRAG